LEPETLKGAVEWYNHIELAGMFTVGILVVSKLINIGLENWLLKKECTACPEIKLNQKSLRDEVLPQLNKNIAALDKHLGMMNIKLDLLMKRFQLEVIEPDKDKDE